MMELFVSKYCFIIIAVLAAALGAYIVVLRQKIARLRSNENMLIQEAYYNPLTQLPNRTNITFTIDEQIDRVMRHSQSFIVYALKIMNYQEYLQKDEAFAKEMVQKAGDILLQATRNEDLVGHIEEDTFIVLFNEYLDEKDFHIVEKRVQEAFQEIVKEAGSQRCEIAMGHSIYPQDGSDGATLIEAAVKNLQTKV